MLYDITKSYLENASYGPRFVGALPAFDQKTPSLHFLGFKLNSPLGVPAGPLLNSRWISLAAKLGFDVLVYKTIRSKEHASLPMPNIIYVDPTGPFSAIEQPDQPPLAHLSITNSFGMPSFPPDYLTRDIHAAVCSLSPGQLLIVSVVGTLQTGVSFVGDFVRAAQLAKEGGAPVIEANFSCPNIERSGGILYTSPEAVQQFTSAIARAIHPTPLILKVGEMDPTLMRSVLVAAARGGAKGICGINSIGMKVTDRYLRPSLGCDRQTSGVCGAALRTRALTFIQNASQIIAQEKLGLSLLGCGGITAPEHFDDMLQAGALIAMSATGMMWDPLIAMRYLREHRTACAGIV